jgi:hypothetical protein
MTPPRSTSGAAPDSPFALDLHIQELVLDGLDSVDPVALGDAVQLALGRLLAENGLPALLAGDVTTGSGVTTPGVVVDAPPNAGVESVGSRVAQAIFAGWSQ